jgi:uncharacterized protein (DUF2384 family)
MTRSKQLKPPKRVRDKGLSALALAARSAAERAGVAIDEALTFIEDSNRRIGSMEARHQEWASMRSIFGDDGLSKLVGVPKASLRRYASGAHYTPREIAERLHWLAAVVADLRGGYNEMGIRRWFERPRAQLGGKTPCQILHDGWHVDHESAKRARALASELSGAQSG